MLNQGTYLQDRYEILGRIGSGGMSVVYKTGLLAAGKSSDGFGKLILCKSKSL